MTQPDVTPISKSERDQLFSSMSQDVRMDFGQVISEIKSQTKESGGAKTKREVIESKKNDCSEELQKRLDAVMRRDQMGPHEGESPPDFDLKRMGSEERVRLSSFKGKKPVALVFGSYT